eukprot:CAMPEP_0177642758 /NCGR_PEP_ID=MMETSP0447-20121125/7780_1 /TAXON_ID=0 /ORGANISM="Stygamoeba regulata, Strain BSH-02190019" /LENGTH=258 /DNA_ID=CAMNT_0019144983 /DNA_START=41 /DNA_END=818 /DNA_ORIENTATION=-
MALLAGLNAVVTGGASGIGAATVRRFCADGAARVAIIDIDVGKGVALEAELASAYPHSAVKFYNADVTDRTALQHAITSFAQEGAGVIHCLVNNAVYFGSKALDASDADWDRTFRVNVVGYASAVQAAHPFLCAGAAAGARGGAAVVKRHRHAHQGDGTGPLQGPHPRELREPRVDLDARGRKGGRQRPREMGAGVGAVPMLRRLGEASEVADAIAFLCSPRASFITASDLPVDGGYLAMSAEGFGDKVKFAGTSSSA